MQNFRENKAYRVSLYLVLLFPIIVVFLLLLVNILHLYYAMKHIGAFVSILFLMPFLLRFISLDPLKRWYDIIFIFSASLLQFFIINLMSGYCLTSIQIPQLNAGQVFQPPQLTIWSMFNTCSHYNINLKDNLQTTAIIFFIVSLVLALWLLISDIKRKRVTTSTI